MDTNRQGRRVVALSRRADRRGDHGKAFARLDATAGAGPSWRGWSRHALGELAAVAWRLAVTLARRTARRGVHEKGLASLDATAGAVAQSRGLARMVSTRAGARRHGGPLSVTPARRAARRGDHGKALASLGATAGADASAVFAERGTKSRRATLILSARPVACAHPSKRCALSSPRYLPSNLRAAAAPDSCSASIGAPLPLARFV